MNERDIEGKKILYISHYGGFYGANKSLLQLILELKDKHKIIPFVILTEAGVFTKILDDNNIPNQVYKYYNWLNANSFFKKKVKDFLNLFYFNKIKYSIEKKIDFDLVHTNTSVTDLGGKIAQIKNKPHVWHLREYGFDDYGLTFNKGIQFAGQFIQSTSEKVISISKDLKDYYSHYINVNNIQVVYNGIKVTPIIVKDYFKDSKVNIAIVGVLSEQKGQLEAIQACKLLLKEHKISNFCLHVLGDGDEEYQQQIQEYIKQHNLQKHVRLVGFVDNVNQYLEQIDLGLVCSKREAFGRVTIEFFLNQIPVIATDTGANPELITLDTGSTYVQGDYVILAKRIKTFIQNKSDIIKKGANARLYAENTFTSDRNSNQIYEIYNQLLGSK